MSEETEAQAAAPGAAHDGPEADGTSQGEPGSAGGSSGAGPEAAALGSEPGAPSDTNERADGRATIVEPGGEEPSPRA
ncbi:MAG: hypothetical protein H0U53_09885 [Actinobacteria bacterium]|nr:hypothetical protein [Actinomycetota bacterium]